LACATTGGKVFVHSPHDSPIGDNTQNTLRFLNINRKITSLATGCLLEDGHSNPDILFIGSESNLLAYDVERNADKFFVDVQDGVNALVVGKTANQAENMVIVGGNCSILGFDDKGREVFWTVTGDNVSSLALCDIDSRNSTSLLVGSDDFEIRIFRGEETIYEISESDRISILNTIDKTMFGYGLANGTVGVYGNAKSRLWRVKTKHKPLALFSYDIDMDGVSEVFSGWSHGGFNIRKRENGEVIFRETMDAPIASILKADYRLDGNEEVMICSESGNVCAYLPTDVEFGHLFESGIGKESVADQKILEELHAEKIELISELRSMEKALKSSKSNEPPVGALPPNTLLSYSMQADLELRALLLKVEANKDVQIINFLAVDLEGVVFSDREVMAFSPKTQSRSATLSLRPSRNYDCKLRVQTHVASRSLQTQLHVFETDINIPKFAAFAQTSEITQYPLPRGVVSFCVKDSIERFVQWIQGSFLLTSRTAVIDGKLKIGFLSVCRTLSGLNVNDKQLNQSSKKRKEEKSFSVEGEFLVLSLSSFIESGQAYTRVKIFCENMELAADVVQDMAKYFKWEELESEADFACEYEKFEQVLKTISDCNSARVNLTADMADDAQKIKALIIRAEDTRLMLDMDSMRKSYTELSAMNNMLIGSYNIRSINHENLLSALKCVNQMIQKASSLRLGIAKSRIISDCRAAVKSNNMQQLFHIIKHGFEPSSMASATVTQVR